MILNKLFIISNEKISNSANNFFCDNLDMKSTPEGLNTNFDIHILARNSSKARSHKINIEKITLSKTLFGFIYSILKSFKEKDTKYLIISISPFTFFASIFLAIFRKKSMTYLRSDGYEEYKNILGFIGPIIYHLMFSVVSKTSHLIGCNKEVLRGKVGKIIYPSQLTDKWFSNTSTAELNKIKLLYIGRIRVEKGIYSLLKIIQDFKKDISLSIVGMEKEVNKTIKQENVNILEIETSEEKLIELYDTHNIFILPSFTEGHPMALLESLARSRPVIIFEEISHVVGSKKGIFIAKRNSESLLEKIEYIRSNYSKIQEDMKNNNLPLKKDFLNEFQSSILNFN
tara:strand:+ start:1167 stop:2195 length:1029 start_codon:yes stop_codon:yes gene_type:complete